jgi:hypothetical protein
VYRGAWGEDGRLVYIDEPGGARPLLPMPDAAAAEWGTDARRSLCVAQAILHHATGDAELTDRLAKAFSELLARLPSHGFALSRDEVLEWITAESSRKNGAPPPRAPARS